MHAYNGVLTIFGNIFCVSVKVKLCFYARKHCFQHVLAITILSVCLSQGWISHKRCKLGLSNLHYLLPGRL